MNINTPVEVAPEGIARYVDLCVDVVYEPSSGARVIDEDELGQAASEGYLPPELAEDALALARSVKEDVGKLGVEGAAEIARRYSVSVT